MKKTLITMTLVMGVQVQAFNELGCEAQGQMVAETLAAATTGSAYNKFTVRQEEVVRSEGRVQSAKYRVSIPGQSKSMTIIISIDFNDNGPLLEQSGCNIDNVKTYIAG